MKFSAKTKTPNRKKLEDDVSYTTYFLLGEALSKHRRTGRIKGKDGNIRFCKNSVILFTKTI